MIHDWISCKYCGAPAAWSKCELCHRCYQRQWRIDNGWKPKTKRKGPQVIPPMLVYMKKLWDAVHNCVAPARKRMRLREEFNALCVMYPEVANTSKYEVPWPRPYHS